MNYKCPFGEGMFRLCDTACRFYSTEPQNQSSKADPNGPGSCTLAHAALAVVRFGPQVERIGNVALQAARKFGFTL